MDYQIVLTDGTHSMARLSATPIGAIGPLKPEWRVSYTMVYFGGIWMFEADAADC